MRSRRGSSGTLARASRATGQDVRVARPSIVPIALTLDDRTGYTLWAPPWEEDGEEWQAFLGTTEGDTAKVHLFPTCLLYTSPSPRD